MLQAGCGEGPEPIPAELSAAPAPGKEDGRGRAGLPVEGDYAETAAWRVANQWEDRDTPAARQVGMAWAQDSGLSWDEKFAAWVGSFEREKAAMGWGDTIVLTTPFGRSLQGPRVDCADLAILLRASFAAWYRLPFFLVAGSNPTVYFGHFGVRTSTGRWEGSPRFGYDLADHSTLSPAAYAAAWPRDARLRRLHVGDDVMSFLGEGEGIGAYLDELHLNKRAARLVWFMQTYLGSQNLADPNNTYNLHPEALRTGDTLVFRRGARGSGHTMVLVRVRRRGDGTMEAEDVYGNLPPAQPKFDSAQATRSNLMNEEGGGAGTNGEGQVYAALGGGLKRWRVARPRGGRWSNTWMASDEASWIDSTDETRLAARLAQLGRLLGEAPFAEQREGLLEQLEQKRAYLREHPASCAARERREGVFQALTSLMAVHRGWTPSQTEASYRSVEDYIFAPLDYQQSRTCCWNSTTPQMAELILSYNAEQQADRCVAPTPFQRVDGGYAVFAAYAEQLGREEAWRDWRADEACLARGDSDVLLDRLQPGTGWCELAEVPPPAAAGGGDGPMSP